MRTRLGAVSPARLRTAAQDLARPAGPRCGWMKSWIMGDCAAHTPAGPRHTRPGPLTAGEAAVLHWQQPAERDAPSDGGRTKHCAAPSRARRDATGPLWCWAWVCAGVGAARSQTHQPQQVSARSAPARAPAPQAINVAFEERICGVAARRWGPALR